MKAQAHTYNNMQVPRLLSASLMNELTISTACQPVIFFLHTSAGMRYRLLWLLLQNPRLAQKGNGAAMLAT